MVDELLLFRLKVVIVLCIFISLFNLLYLILYLFDKVLCLFIMIKNIVLLVFWLIVVLGCLKCVILLFGKFLNVVCCIVLFLMSNWLVLIVFLIFLKLFFNSF